MSIWKVHSQKIIYLNAALDAENWLTPLVCCCWLIRQKDATKVSSGKNDKVDSTTFHRESSAISNRMQIMPKTTQPRRHIKVTAPIFGSVRSTACTWLSEFLAHVKATHITVQFRNSGWYECISNKPHNVQVKALSNSGHRLLCAARNIQSLTPPKCRINRKSLHFKLAQWGGPCYAGQFTISYTKTLPRFTVFIICGTKYLTFQKSRVLHQHLASSSIYALYPLDTSAPENC